MGAQSGSLLLLFLLTVLPVCECGSKTVVGLTGENVTLPCKYDIGKHGRLTVCWGRGEIPTYGCADQIIYTDGSTVNEASGRYQLLGNLDAGDVSLTILNSTEKDTGLYGCRVQVYGWLNDEKHPVDLIIERAPEPITSSTSDTVTSSEQTPDNYTQQADHMNSTESWDTSSPTSRHTNEASSSDVPVVLVCVLFACVVLLTAVGVVFIVRRRRNKLNKTQRVPNQQQIVASVRFSSSSASLQLGNSRASSAVENVYQVEEEATEYESCP